MMFLSNCCAEVTSSATTNACTGCCSACDMVCANWLWSEAPTILKSGACIEGEAVEPPDAPLFGISTDAIFLTFANPESIIDATAGIFAIVGRVSSFHTWLAPM